MTEIQIGDRVSIELVVTKAADIIEARLPFRDGVSDLAWEGISAHRTFFTLLRRAPVDLASVEIPEDGSGVPVLYYGEPARLLGRQHRTAFLRNSLGNLSMCAIDYHELRPIDAPAPAIADPRPSDDRLWDQTLRERDHYHDKADELATAIGRHFDVNVGEHSNMNCRWDAALQVINSAPAPDKSEVERLRSALVGTHNALMKYEWYCNPKSGWASDDCKTLRQEVEEALASKDPASSFAFRDENGDVQLQETPSCPPGHIMIGDRAVPEPMREAPKTDEKYWMPYPIDDGLVLSCRWDDHKWDRRRLQRGLIHSTEAAARAHAEALIALSAGEG